MEQEDWGAAIDWAASAACSCRSRTSSCITAVGCDTTFARRHSREGIGRQRQKVQNAPLRRCSTFQVEKFNQLAGCDLPLRQIRHLAHFRWAASRGACPPSCPSVRFVRWCRSGAAADVQLVKLTSCPPNSLQNCRSQGVEGIVVGKSESRKILGGMMRKSVDFETT